MGKKLPSFFSRLFIGPHRPFGVSQIPLKPLESLMVYQAPGSAVCRARRRAVVWIQPGGGQQRLWGRPESWESLSHIDPVFVYGALLSYLPPVLTPHSSCFKSLLLIFSSLLPQSQPVLLFFWRSCSFQARLDRVSVATEPVLLLLWTRVRSSMHLLV